MADLESKYRPILEGALEDGEDLRGLCVASQQKSMFKGGVALIGTTDRRLLVQPLDRGGNPVGSPQPIAPEEISSAKAGPAGGGWINVDTAILDHAAVRLRIQTTDGKKLKLMLMRGEGKLLGGLGGGEAQRQGLEALAEWFSRVSPR